MLALELHAHTEASEDSLVRPRDLAEMARRRGLDRIAITDHNAIGGALEFQARAPDLAIVGEEVMTTQGELLAFFVREVVPAGLAPSEAIARLRAQGAVISVSHPFDRYRQGHWQASDLAAILPHVDAIEVFNARCLQPEDNSRALAFARENGIPGSVGSDAHSLREYGRARALMEAADTRAALLAGLRAGQSRVRLSSPAIHLTSRWAKLWKTLTRRRP